MHHERQSSDAGMAERGCCAKAHARDRALWLYCRRANRRHRLSRADGSSPNFVVPRLERPLGRTKLVGFVRVGRETPGSTAGHEARRMVADRRVRATLEIVCHAVTTLCDDASVGLYAGDFGYDSTAVRTVRCVWIETNSRLLTTNPIALLRSTLGDYSGRILGCIRKTARPARRILSGSLDPGARAAMVLPDQRWCSDRL